MTARSPHRRLRPRARALAGVLAASALALGLGGTSSAHQAPDSYLESLPSAHFQAASSNGDPATRFAVGSLDMTVAQQVAAQYWGMNACGGQVTISWTQLDPDINAQSTWDNPLSAYDNPDQNTDCQIQFNPVVPFDWPMFCTVAVHEYGHLTGHPHVNDENNVMNPYYVKPIGACATTPDPSAPPAPPAGHSAAAAGTHKTVHRKVVHRKVVHRHRKVRRHRRHRRVRHHRRVARHR